MFCYADFASLEDRVSALLTKDKNKLKVYTDSFDGHCLRAYAYFKNAMPDIQMQTEGRTYCIETNEGEKKYMHESETIKLNTGKEITLKEYILGVTT